MLHPTSCLAWRAHCGTAVLCTLALAGCVTVPIGESCRNGTTCQTSAIHRVEQGESLDAVAAEFGTSRDELVAYNKIKTSDCAPGTVLKIPPRRMETAEARRWWATPVRGAEGC